MNVGASYAWTGGPGFAHSAAAKAGVKNMVETLAVEWGPYGIQVNGLVPGLMPHEDMTADIQGKGTYHRVRVGPFATLDELDRTRSRLKQKGITSNTPIRPNSTA